LPGVGQNLHDHLLTFVIHEASREIPAPKNNILEAHLFAKSDPRLLVPDHQPLFMCNAPPLPTLEIPANSYAAAPGIIRPAARGELKLTAADPAAPLHIDPRYLCLVAKRRNRGCSFPVTLIADLDNGNPLVDEEQFGPVLPIIRYADVYEVLARANDNPHGLGGSVWSKDIQKAKDIALQLQCGTAWINKHGPIQPNAPFGGVKSSGFGVEFGEEGLFENTDAQVVWS
jgi:hypothetical protein